MNYYRNIIIDPEIMMSCTLLSGKNVFLKSEDEIINMLCSNPLSSVLPDGISINKNLITKIDFYPGYNLDYIPDNFCMHCIKLNNEFEIPSTVVDIGDNFLYDCQNFNSMISFPNRLRKIGKSFLYKCVSFNQPIDSLITITDSVGPYFMAFCKIFNQSLNLNNWTFDILSHHFMNGCENFNQSINLYNFKEIQCSFLYNCKEYSQSISISSKTTLVDGYDFMSNCRNFTGPIYINTNPNNFQFPGINGGNVDTLLSVGASNTSYPMYQTGVTVSGTYATQFKTKFSGNPTSGYYRKLV